MRHANYWVLAITVAGALSAGARPSSALPAGPIATANTGTITSDLVQVASKKKKSQASQASSAYGYYRPNPSPPGGWSQSGGVSLPPSSLMASDSRLKEAMIPLKQLDNGIELYRFRYKGDSETYVGVIAQQVARLVPDAVVRGEDGYLRVDYGRLGLRMMTWAEWKLGQGHSN